MNKAISPNLSVDMIGGGLTDLLGRYSAAESFISWTTMTGLDKIKPVKPAFSREKRRVRPSDNTRGRRQEKCYHLFPQIRITLFRMTCSSLDDLNDISRLTATNIKANFVLLSSAPAAAKPLHLIPSRGMMACPPPILLGS